MTPETARMATVKRTLHVNAPIEYAFRVLAEKMGTWWPTSHHIGKTPFTEIVVEPRVGGRWFERDAAGVECDWGRVLVWEPPKQLVLAWHLQPDFQYSPDTSRASEVSFDFIAEGPEATRVEFEHRRIERHGKGWEKLFAGVDSPGGWTGVLVEFENAVAGQPKTGHLSQAERELALSELAASQEALLQTTKGLTPAQWKFKPAADRWSIAECAEHVGIIEDLAYRLITEKALKAPAEPEKRKAIRYSDPGILKAASEREPRLSAPESVQPTGRWSAPDELLQNLTALRARTVKFMKTTQEDLRNHFLQHPAFGILDTYQWVLLISCHMQRHSSQIQDVKAHGIFPKA